MVALVGSSDEEHPKELLQVGCGREETASAEGVNHHHALNFWQIFSIGSSMLTLPSSTSIIKATAASGLAIEATQNS